MASRKIAVLGAGKAGEALIAGLLSSGWREPSEVVATARHEERLAELGSRYGIATTLSNADAAEGAGVVVIAVKPQDIESLLRDVGETLTSDQTVVTIAAAIPTALIENHLADGVPVVRAMPNTPVTVHEGMAGIAAGAHAGEEHLAAAEDVLGSVGRSVRVDESYMDAITAVSGSGPAYVFFLIDQLTATAIDKGFTPEQAALMVEGTFRGASELLAASEDDPAELRRRVTSPKGTTERAIAVLEEARLKEVFDRATDAALARARELAAGA